MPTELLLAEHGINRVLCRYARALDERNWDALDEVFAEDCVARYGEDPEHRGRSAVVNAIRRYLEHCGPTQHLIGNLEVDPDSENFVSRCYVRAAHRARVGDATFWSLGQYVARWRKSSAGFLAIRWEMRIAFNSGDPSVLEP